LKEYLTVIGGAGWGERGGERVGERVGEKVGENLTENQNKILKAIMQEPRITASKLSKILHISVRKTEENIRKLKDIELLVRIGPDKGGHWKVVEKNEKVNG